MSTPVTLSRHPDAKELAQHFKVKQSEVHDAFSSSGQILGNVPRSVAIAIMEEWLGECQE